MEENLYLRLFGHRRTLVYVSGTGLALIWPGQMLEIPIGYGALKVKKAASTRNTGLVARCCITYNSHYGPRQS